MYNLLAKKPIYQQDPAPLTPEETDAYFRKFDPYRPFFRTEDEWQLFCMLPVKDDQRKDLLKVMAREHHMVREVLNCTGKEDSDSIHRDKCISCVTMFRPGIAVPYY